MQIKRKNYMGKSVEFRKIIILYILTISALYLIVTANKLLSSFSLKKIFLYTFFLKDYCVRTFNYLCSQEHTNKCNS